MLLMGVLNPDRLVIGIAKKDDAIIDTHSLLTNPAASLRDCFFRAFAVCSRLLFGAVRMSIILHTLGFQLGGEPPHLFLEFGHLRP